MVLKKVKLSICSNPDCQRPFENLIIISDRSKNPYEKFYGCPNCFFKMDPTVTDSLKNIEKVIELEEPINGGPLEETIVSNCPKYFGYLADNIANSIISIKCLDCEKMGDCMRAQQREQKSIKDDDGA